MFDSGSTHLFFYVGLSPSAPVFASLSWELDTKKKGSGHAGASRKSLLREGQVTGKAEAEVGEEKWRKEEKERKKEGESRDGSGPGKGGYPTEPVPYGESMEDSKRRWRRGWKC